MFFILTFQYLIITIDHFMYIPKRFQFKFPFFVNKGTLIDDLSFSFYFHSTSMNQVLHFSTVMVLYSSVIILLHEISLAICLLFLLSYGGFLTFLDYISGIGFIIWFIFCLIVSLFESSLSLPFAVGCIILLPPLQLLGHVVYERRLPAFRAFEALVTTPLLLMILFLNKFGIHQDVVKEIRLKSKQWVSYPQKTFGK